jgi:alpha-1,2-mannosyltransferase
MNGESLTTSSRRLWWCGLFLGVAGATKVWAVFPLVAVLIVVRRAGFPAQRRIAGGAVLGFVACCLPFIAGAPISFFTQVVLTQAIRNEGGLPLLARLADLTGLPGLSGFVSAHTRSGIVVLSGLGAATLGTALVGRHWSQTRPPWTPLERLVGWSALIVGVGLLASPSYYYHYSGFMAPFVALVVGTSAGRLRAPLRRVFGSPLLPGSLAVVAVSSALALMVSASVDEIVTLPSAPHVGDVVSDAIPPRGCVLYANPTLALLDNRFTSEVSGCPNVIDWLGQERVLDDGQSASGSDATNARLQEMMSRWIESSDAIVLEKSNLGLDSANQSYLTRHFDRRRDVPRGLRIYVRPTAGRPDADPPRASGRAGRRAAPLS